MDKALQEMISEITSFGLLGIFSVLGTWAVIKLIQIAWATAKTFINAVIADLKEREDKAIQRADKHEAAIINLMQDMSKQHAEVVDRVVETLNQNTQALKSLKEFIQGNKFKTDP